MGVPVYVLTSDKYTWALAPFSYLFNLFWSSLQPVTVMGYNPPSYQMPKNFKFFSVSRQNYPSERWSDALIEFLSRMEDHHFCLLLEDYWLCRTVDVGGVATLYEYMCQHPDVLRMDLTADRLYAGGMYDLEYYGHYDIIETPESTPYQMSTQAGIWSKELLLKLLQHNKSAWETEIQTYVPSEIKVRGTRQSPIRYANGILKGKLDKDQLKLIPQPLLAHIAQWFPEGIETT